MSEGFTEVHSPLRLFRNMLNLNYFLHRDFQFDTHIKGLCITPMVKTTITPYMV